jgi:hypothetical protein
MLSVKLKNDIQPVIRADGEPMEQNPLVLFYRVEDKTAIMLRYRLVKIIMISHITEMINSQKKYIHYKQ